MIKLRMLYTNPRKVKTLRGKRFKIITGTPFVKSIQMTFADHNWQSLEKLQKVYLDHINGNLAEINQNKPV